jgi:hypothetical protein
MRPSRVAFGNNSSNSSPILTTTVRLNHELRAFFNRLKAYPVFGMPAILPAYSGCFSGPSQSFGRFSRTRIVACAPDSVKLTASHPFSPRRLSISIGSPSRTSPPSACSSWTTSVPSLKIKRVYSHRRLVMCGWPLSLGGISTACVRPTRSSLLQGFGRPPERGFVRLAVDPHRVQSLVSEPGCHGGQVNQLDQAPGGVVAERYVWTLVTFARRSSSATTYSIPRAVYGPGFSRKTASSSMSFDGHGLDRLQRFARLDVQRAAAGACRLCRRRRSSQTGREAGCVAR